MNEEENTISNLTKEDISYIYSEEFILKFGDWEKANRIEKLKKSKPLFLDKKIIVFGKDRTEDVNRYRKEKNIKALSKIVTDISQEMVQKLRAEQNLTPGESPILKVHDGNRAFNINISMLKDVAHHNLLQKGHIESIYNIPKIVGNTLYIGKEDNEDKRKPELKQFYYFAEGIKIENNDYTAKVVFIKNDKGEFFYDQSLSTIEKVRFLESIKKLPEVLNQINRLEYFGSSDGTPSTYYDKRLINICQVPQMPYLEKVNGKWLPTKETVKAVKAGNLYIQKNGQEYKMVDLYSNLTKEDISYIYSEEFISRFGDWEKANRIEKLKAAESLVGDERVIVQESDVTDLADRLRSQYSPSNMKQLQSIARSIGKDVLNELRKKQGLNEYDYPIIKNEDQNISYKIQSSSMKEISRHNIFQKGHIEAIRFIPSLIKKAIFIGAEKNEDGRNPSLKKFFYYGAGLKIGNEVYTSKIVFIENDRGEIFYDASHSTIEKGKLIDIIQKKNKPETFNPQKRQDNSGLLENKSPVNYYDKRLINICQVPQMPYLEKINGKWLPTKEAVKAVKAGNLYIQKSGQEYKMVDLYFSLTKEDISYIYSEEFILKFGDWEKADRLEKFRLSDSIKKDEKIILNGSDITSTVESLIENEDRKGLQALEKEIGKTILGKYQNDDTGIFVNVSNRNVTEISNHHYLFKEHIQSLAYIPEIIEKATFIAEVENEDKKKHPNIEKYLYFGTGLNLSGEEYTCKSIIGVDSSKNCYYDQSLSTIEKGKLIDCILQNKKSGNLSPLITQRETGLEGNEMPYVYYDKRLINICQVPQMPYLEKINGKWLPTKEAVKAVKAGNLYIQKNDQEYKMIDNRNNSKDIKNNIFFTYNDFNFVAVRKFSEEEKTFVDSVISNEQNKKLLSKNALYYAGYLESQKPATEQKFEKALKVFSKADFLQSSNSDADIFYCREKGTFYTALNNDFLVPLEFVYSSDRQEKDVFENRFSDEIESFRNDNYDFLKGTLSYELDEEKDFALMSDISDVLSEGEIFTRRNVNIDGEIKIKLGDLFDKKNPEKIQPTGLRHLIKHRMEERLNNGLSMEEAQRETTAVLFLALNNIDKAPAVKEQNGRYAIYKNGIKTLIGKDKKGKYVVSGFDYIDTKREATDSIGTGIARYGYTPGFLEIYDQVGAVASELNIHKKNSHVNDKADEKNLQSESVFDNFVENGQEYKMVDNRSSLKNDDMSFYYERFSRKPQMENEVAQLQKALALALEKNVSPLKEVELNRKNWNKMFPDGTVETPVATVKLGENQFDKLRRNDRNNLLAAMYETLSNPAIVLEKETLDEKSGEFKPVNVYGKSFIHENSNHKRAVESVIIFKDGKNISIGTHNKNIKDFVKQIKTADQIIYADSEISRVASLILQNGGSHVRLHDAISNRAINSHYDKNNLLSINNLQFSESKNNLKESIQFEYDGLTYMPIRSLSENEKDLINNRSPKEYWNNAIIEKPKNGENYSIEDFKKKSQSQNADLFYCIERGKFFTPVENGIINLNEGLIDEHFREELNNFYNNENVQKLIKNHRPLVFNEKKDISLMQNISSVLTESEVFSKNNETLGNVRIKFGNPEHGGVSHIIKRRMDKLIKHEGMRYYDAVRETSAILYLSLQNISNAPATKETNGRYAIYKNGIKTAIDTDKNGKFVVTGFDFNDTRQEAADAIKSVNALYGYTTEFLDIYAQVGAAYASLSSNINQQNVPVNDKEPDYKKLLYSSTKINVNGRIRHCKEGLVKGFENAVSRLDSCFAENSSLKNENIKLKSQLDLMNNKCEKLIQDNEELKNQALKNKIRPMGM